MTDTTAFWTDPANAGAWVAADAQVQLLDLPRRIAAELVAVDRPETRTVADVGSGTGPFLATFLERFPNASGIWVDVSPSMRDAAQDSLARYGNRVGYRLANMSDLDDLPEELDVVMTSRCSHHLTPSGLTQFYSSVASHLSAGGWLINLDHARHEPTWDSRLRGARSALLPRRAAAPGHHHDRPLPTLREHLSALKVAGFVEIEVAWQAFVTHLVVARKPPELPSDVHADTSTHW